MKTIIKMKLELEYFSPYFKIIRPEKLLLFQLSQNSSQNASKQTTPSREPLYLFNGYLPFYLHIQSTPKHTASR